MNDVLSPQISNETEFSTHISIPLVQRCLCWLKIPSSLISWTLLRGKPEAGSEEAGGRSKASVGQQLIWVEKRLPRRP